MWEKFQSLEKLGHRMSQERLFRKRELRQCTEQNKKGQSSLFSDRRKIVRLTMDHSLKKRERKTMNA
jgi:hypothetical protein